MNTITAVYLTSILLMGCAHGHNGQAPTGTPATEVRARRVMQIFQRRHLQPRQFDAAPSDELMLDAFAKAHDPHSAYLTSDALTRLRTEIHQPPPDVMRVRGRVVGHAGVRIALMVVKSFYLHADRSTSQDAAYVAQQLLTQGADVLVLDMRSNTGGVESEAAKLVGLFAGPGPIAQTVTADGTVEILRADGAAVWSGPLVVAVDALSASMTEVAAAALQDRGHALVVGQRTHGKGTGQTLVLLSSPHGGRDGAVRVTDRRFHRLDGRPLQQLGVTPDVELPTSATIKTERDRPGALAFDAIAPIDTTPPLRTAPSGEAFPFAAALAWLRAEVIE